MFGLGAAIATGVLALGGSIFSAYMARQANQATIAARKEAARIAWQRQLKMWRKRNKYNLPSNQMQRLQAAGLNPNLVYGSGNVTGNVVASIPDAPMPQLTVKKPTPNIAAAINAAINTRMAIATLQNKQARNENIKADTLVKLARHRGILSNVEYQEIKNHILSTIKDQRVAQANLKTELMTGKVDIQQQQIKNMQAKFQRIIAEKATAEQREILLSLKSVFQRIQNQYAQQGVMPKDDVIFRLLLETWQNIIKPSYEYIQGEIDFGRVLRQSLKYNPTLN